MPASTPPPMTTIDEIRARHRESGQDGYDWFAPWAMAVASTRLSAKVYPAADGSTYFVSSEDSYPNPRRYFTVRRALVNGAIVVVGVVAGYRSRSGAHAAAARYAEAQTP